MGHEITIGGQRLGSGNKMKAYLKNYERSTHDLSYVWRSTMSAGTLVPFMSEVALPGDTFDIDLNCDVLTHPTIGPLFGSYKVQLDTFQIPIRLYQGALHMNMLGIGMDMSKIWLPRILMDANPIDLTLNLDNQHINPSCIFSYLGIRGLGYEVAGGKPIRYFNAVPYLGYWDIYKNYYANKQEEIGAMIHKNPTEETVDLTSCKFNDTQYGSVTIPVDATPPYTFEQVVMVAGTSVTITGTGITEASSPSNLRFYTSLDTILPGDAIFNTWENVNNNLIGSNPKPEFINILWEFGNVEYDNAGTDTLNAEPEILTFPLENIDTMRKRLLIQQMDLPLDINNTDEAPYGTALQFVTLSDLSVRYSKTYGQEGLALKTYNSDLFNNWISTEWIDGPDGISAVTAIDTSDGSFTIDELNLSKKVYDMLNRIALSGGSYDDWLDAVYTHDRQRSAENPMYLGGLIKNLVFQEVVSNSRSLNQPLGTLAGRGKMGSKNKGGHVIAKIDEPSYIMGIVSITPNVDYSQGNKWDVNLVTMNDFHKPALDEIGFQDLVTDQMAWYDTPLNAAGTPTFKSAGKQPAWINYMTNVNVVRGNFADQNQQMFMVLNRRYGVTSPDGTAVTIKDLTTYIDPSKFNHIFADTRRDAQNFWCQIGVNITARRKMSAKVIPNL